MKERAGKRVQIKRLRWQIKQALELNQDPSLLSQKLEQVISSETPTYHLKEIQYEPAYPDYKTLDKTDPRYKTYKIRHLFGKDD